MRFFLKHLIYFLFLITTLLSGQEKYPKDDFISPVDFPISLSGTFGELRTGHLHSGIDIRTQGVEGKPVKAIADGYVSRIVVSPFGYGKAIYIDHPNGYTSAYAHLQSFYPAVNEFVKNEQYRRESFALDIKLLDKEFEVKQGQVIAKSGNSGSSGGPHIHFEIRDTDDEIPINPLFFGFKVKDFTRPQIQRLLIYPHGQGSRVSGKTRYREIELAGWGPVYRPKPGNDTISVSGSIYFGIEAFDRHNDSQMNNGVYSVKLLIDSVLVYSHRMDRFSFDETRQMLALIDYAYLVKNKKRIQRTIVMPNNQLSIYEKVKYNGIYNFLESRIYRLQYVVGDVEGNESVLTFHIKGGQSDESQSAQGATLPEGVVLMRWDRTSTFEREGFILEIPDEALFDTIHFKYSAGKPISGGYSPVYNVHNQYTPILKSCNLSIKPQDFPPEKRDKLLIVKVDQASGKFTAAGGKWDDDFLSVKIREFGNYTVVADTKPPIITPVNVQNGKNISGQSTIRFNINDNLAGIETYRATMNGEWILMEWDPKNNLLEYKIDERTKKGKNQLRLTVTDTSGNEAVYEASLVR